MGMHPVEPGIQAGARGGRNSNHGQGGIDSQGEIDGFLHVEIHVGEEVRLVDQHQTGSGKHVRILEGFIVPLGHRQHHDLGLLAQVKSSRAHQIAHVLYQQHAFNGRRQSGQGLADHQGIQMTALARIDLQGRRTGGSNALCVKASLLVTFDHTHGHPGF